jgi:hypothetical protein
MGLKDWVRDTIPEYARGGFSDHFNVIGDIAVLTLPLRYLVMHSALPVQLSHGVITSGRY